MTPPKKPPKTLASDSTKESFHDCLPISAFARCIAGFSCESAGRSGMAAANTTTFIVDCTDTKKSHKSQGFALQRVTG